MVENGPAAFGRQSCVLGRSFSRNAMAITLRFRATVRTVYQAEQEGIL